eukprot:scaffold165740_cov24-Tisochrysis_lutea.AAC.1
MVPVPLQQRPQASKNQRLSQSPCDTPLLRVLHGMACKAQVCKAKAWILCPGQAGERQCAICSIAAAASMQSAGMDSLPRPGCGRGAHSAPVFA